MNTEVVGTGAEAPTLSRRERKKRRTRETLRACALRLFAERGFHETTVEDITDAADLSPRTFFLHFASKEEVVVGSPDHLLGMVRERLSAMPAGIDPLEAARRVIRGMVEDIGEQNLCLLRDSHQRQGHAPPDTAHKLKYFLLLEQYITEQTAAATGLDARTDLYPTLLGQVVTTGMRAAMSVWLERDASTSLGDLVDQTFAALASGLSLPPAVATPQEGAAAASQEVATLPEEVAIPPEEVATPSPGASTPSHEAATASPEAV